MRMYVGMDVHRKRSQVALVDEHGGQLLNRNLANDSAELTSTLGRLEPGTPVAFEAAYGWGWLAELLEELELEPHLVHPSRCKAIASARLKDDRVDARTLAQLLRAELLPEAWIAPQAVRDQRALLRHRAALVRVATALKCRVHAILADRGVGVTEPLWGPSGRVLLAELDLPTVQRTVVTDCLALIDAISPLVARLERDLLARTKPDPRVQALQALPGIGPHHRHDLGRRDRRHRPLPDRPQVVRLGRTHAGGAQLRPQGPPRSHHQDGLTVGPLRAPRGRPAGQDPSAVRFLLCQDRRPPRQAHRHRGGRP
jgi:transposase